jgi:hypothetical protein
VQLGAGGDLFERNIRRHGRERRHRQCHQNYAKTRHGNLPF